MLNRKAFTIVELLVVVSVLAILIGMAIPRIKGFNDNANIAKVKKELQTLRAATESYYMFRSPSVYPGYSSPGFSVSTTTQATYLVSAAPRIIPSILYDPFVAGGATEYRFQTDINGKYYVWFSVGPNGTFAGCFTAGTKILLADGKKVSIENLKKGDILLGAQGALNKVLHLSILPKMKRKIYAFNGGRNFVTEDHPFMTKGGWKSLNPKLSKQNYFQLKVGKLKIGDKLVTQENFLRLHKIEFKEVKDSVVFSLELDGNHTYYADGFLVHNGFAYYISASGVVTRSGDDICVTNGTGC